MKHKIHTLLLLSLLATACQSNQAANTPAKPQPSVSPITKPSNTPTPSESARPDFSLKGQFNDPDYMFGYAQGQSPKLKVTHPGSTMALEAKFATDNSFTLDKLPQGTDLTLEMTYPNQHVYTYVLKADQIQADKKLLISPAQGAFFEGSSPPELSKIHGNPRSQMGFSAPRNIRIKARSLDPKHPFEASVINNDCGNGFVFAGVPPQTPLEISADFPNFQPLVIQQTSPPAGQKLELDLSPRTIWPELLRQLADPNPGLNAGMDPNPVWAIVQLQGFVANTIKDATYKATSLDSRVPFEKSAEIREGRFYLDLPVGVDLKLTTTFDGNMLGKVAFDGTLERSIYFLAADYRQNLNPYNSNVEALLSPSASEIYQPINLGFTSACDISSGANLTTLTGSVSNKRGNPLSGVKVAVRSLPNPGQEPVFYEAVATTGPSGKFTFPSVQIGIRYEVTSTAKGQEKTELITPVPNFQGAANLNKLDLQMDF